MNIKLNNRYINELLEYEKVQNGLYIVATPIGNLGDITLRSLKILSCVDLILCEDTRISKKLTNKYGIKTQLKPFHKFNSTNSIPLIIKKLQAGLSIAIISDAGTPIISDPGSDLIKICDEKKINVFSLPGPSATISSYVLSSFAQKSFMFRSFFPRHKNEALKELDLIKKLECAVIFFESPLRILKTLNFINDHYGSCEITLVRELTKKNEEVINSNITEVIEKLRNRKKILGEITFVVKPLCHNKENKISNEEISILSDQLIAAGLNTSKISKIISTFFNLSRREVYQLLIKNKQ